MKTTAAIALFVLGSAPAWAGKVITATPVPTLDEGGLVALIALVGLVGGLIARRRK